MCPYAGSVADCDTASHGAPGAELHAVADAGMLAFSSSLLAQRHMLPDEAVVPQHRMPTEDDALVVGNVQPTADGGGGV